MTELERYQLLLESRIARCEKKIWDLEKQLILLESILEKNYPNKLTISQASAKYKVSRKTLQQHIIIGRLRNISDTRRKLLLESDVARFYALR